MQNAVFVSFNQTLEQQIERLLRISHLYENIGFFRKAAFYKRFAALKAIAFPDKNQNWEKCYYLLLSSAHGYKLNLDPEQYDTQLTTNTAQWPTIHVQLLQEMITTSIKMKNETLAMRHLSFILQCLFSFITPDQRKDFATKLSRLASKCGEGSPVTLKLINNANIPSVNFTKFPTVLYFKVEPLVPKLRPYKLKSLTLSDDVKPLKSNSDVFIYTPLNLDTSFTSSPKRKSDSIKVNFYWTEGDLSNIRLSLHNYLPIELNISSITVLSDGVAFEPDHDTSLRMASGTSNTNIQLTGIPRSTGMLDILGYRIHALGIKSDCRLTQLPNAKKLKLPTRFTVEVVPRLPVLRVSCQPQTVSQIPVAKESVHLFPEMDISSSTSISLYEGKFCVFSSHLIC